MNIRQLTGLVLGLTGFLILVLIPSVGGMAPLAQKMAGIVILMACFWIGEVIPIEATSLFPLIGLPLFGIASSREAAAPYADHIIFLFLGGFLIATAMRKCNLHQRIALHLTRRVGTSPRRLVLGFMIATAFLSMWISNTATTIMMFPIGLAVISRLLEEEKDSHPHQKNFAPALMLGIAYAASVGGVATLIGTPPNAIFAGSIKKLFPAAGEISFSQWFFIGLPLALILIPLIWLFLVRFALPVPRGDSRAGREIIEKELKKLGPWSRAEKVVFIIFITTAFLWAFRRPIEIGPLRIPGWSSLLPHPKMIHDSTVAIFMSFLLFLIPVDWKKREFALNWEWAVKIPWGVLILLGGGFSLARGVQSSGLAHWLGNSLSGFQGIHPVFLVLAICLMMTFLTEVTSNSATSTLMMPVLASLSLGLRVHPLLLMIPATISASCAFMLPVATPPNAIVFGSGYITIPQMARVGLALNLAGALFITLLTFALICPIFGISPSVLPPWAQN